MPQPQQRKAPERQPRATVLAIDDEDSFHEIVEHYVRAFRILKAKSGWEALGLLQEHHVDVVLLDLNLGDTNGLKLLDEIRAEASAVEVIVITAHSTIHNAVEAVKKGAFDFLAKTHENYEQLAQHIGRALEHRKWKREQIEARTRLNWLKDAFQLLENSESPAVAQLLALARDVAPTPINVLIEGESGVGKEILARYVHTLSDRRAAPFVPVNLSAVPASLLESHLFGHIKGAFTSADQTRLGKFELADTGTIFLDEIGELSESAQVKLLRVLQEREIERLGAPEPTPIDVRVVAATNKDLAAEVAAGRFREDLYYRLNVVRLYLPPLRERVGDIPALLQALARRHGMAMHREPPTFSHETIRALQRYEWPGNIRELENLVMRFLATHPGRHIGVSDIPVEYRIPSIAEKVLARTVDDRGARRESRRLYFEARHEFERYLVRHMVQRCGSRREAARVLGMSYSTLKEKLRESERTDSPLSGVLADDDEE